MPPQPPTSAPTPPPPPDDPTAYTALTPIATLPAPHGRGGPTSRAWQARAHPDPKHAPLLGVAGADKNVYVWSLRTFALVSTVAGGHKRSVRCVGWKDYGGGEGDEGMSRGRKRKVTLATGSFDANVGVWEHAAAARRAGWGVEVEEEVGGGDTDGPMEMEIEDGGNDEDDDAEEWNFTTLLTGPDSEIKGLAFSPRGYSANLLATSSRDKSVWVWEEVEDEEWETIAVLQEHQGDVKCVRWCEGVSVTNADGEETIVGGREILASGSYDDTVRLWRDVEEEGDWACVSVLEGHDGTVWDLCWEGWVADWQKAVPGWELDWEPRIITCSDDLSLRVWRRQLSEAEREKKRNASSGGAVNGLTQRLPSILKPTGYFETWAEEARLPQVHVRSVYAVDWSRRTGLVVSCAGDGTIAVYREVPVNTPSEPAGQMDVPMTMPEREEAPDTNAAATAAEQQRQTLTRWDVVAMVEAAHEEYEINHVCWAARCDGGVRFEDEEVIVSTGDDGDVRIWALPEELCKS